MARRPSKFVDPLSEEDRDFLNDVWRHHRVYTVRCRAHAILLSEQGYTVREIQDALQISKPTALSWIDRWQDRGRDGLEDAPRPGGPPILDAEEEAKLKEIIQQHPRDPRQILRALQEETGKQISRTTLRRLTRKFRLSWKRFRRSTKHLRDEQEFREAQAELEELRQAEDIDVAYFDESAFSLDGVTPYGWQPIGERLSVPIGSARGTLQVLGIHEERTGQTLGYLHRGRVYGSTIAEILDEYSRMIFRPTVLVLDNASVHTCKLILLGEQLPIWNERGLYLFFLPTYSPELNRIEGVWKEIKYRLLPLDAWSDFDKLLKSVVSVFNNIGYASLMPSLQD